jgi:hypothetical protein
VIRLPENDRERPEAEQEKEELEDEENEGEQDDELEPMTQRSDQRLEPTTERSEQRLRPSTGLSIAPLEQWLGGGPARLRCKGRAPSWPSSSEPSYPFCGLPKVRWRSPVCGWSLSCRSGALQCATLLLVHRAFDVLRRGFGILCAMGSNSF